MNNVISENGPEWHGKIYQKSMRREIPEIVRAWVKQRDNYECQVTVCKAKRKLECHHIIPDAEGGKTEEDNLILLCQKCHDEIEETTLRTRRDIHAYVPDWYLVKNKTTRKTEPEKPVEGTIEDWHVWVYGGGKNPRR